MKSALNACTRLVGLAVSLSMLHVFGFSWEKATRETMEVYQSVERSVSTGYVPADRHGVESGYQLR